MTSLEGQDMKGFPPPVQELRLLLPLPPCRPHFGIAHALCLGLAPWMAAEVPYMVESGVITAKV